MLVVLLTAGALLPVTTAAPAAAAPAPDGSRSTITQEVVNREPNPGGGWTITIEATLHSNAVCHVLLFQCVVEPELAPANLTLQSVQCLSPAWHPIKITIPFAGTVVDVCARFDAERAGRDQKFRFTYTTLVDVGNVSETVRFFRFPEEYFFIRAQDTISIELAAQADTEMDCPDSAAIGTTIPCSVRVEALSNIPAASVTLPAQASFTNTSLTPDSSPGDWDCSAVSACTYTANGGVLPIGEYTFTAPADVIGPEADAQRCATTMSGATQVTQGCDPVRVYDANVDTMLDIEKTAPVTEIPAGARLTFDIAVSNIGANAGQSVRVFETPPALLTGATIRFVGGGGTWTCASSTTLQCTAPSLGIGRAGAVALFEVTGTVSASAPAGSAIVNEVTAEWVNDPFGPDFPARDGALVQVQGGTAPPATAVTATPRFTG